MNTMKRKFSLNLPPVKVPLRSASDANHADPPTSSHTSSHRRHQSKDSWSASSSPFISRRALDAQTERELRVACKLILQNFKPSDADFVDVDPRLDFSGPHKHRDHRSEPAHPLHSGKEVRVHRPTGAPSDLQSAQQASKTPAHGTKYAVKAYPELPMLANTSRRRDEREREREREREKEAERGRSITSPSHDTARNNAIVRTDIDSDDAKSLSTPLTASTDPHLNSGSTAPTSVGSNRGSRQYESVAAVADAQATEWMRQELEKRRKDSSATHSDQPQAQHRPPSRAGSIKAGIKEYIFPGSKTLSRSQSKESMRTTGSQQSGGLKRSGSVNGWRSWGLTRLSSTRSSSRLGTSSGRMEKPEHDKKSEVDLNRKLPPLPSLDTWKDPEAEKETTSKDRRNSHQMQGPHIANVMRTQEEYATAIRRHRKSGSDSLALRYNGSQPSVARVKSPDHSVKSRHKGGAVGLSDTSMDFDYMMSSMSTHNLDDSPGLVKHVAQRSTSSIPRSPTANFAADGRLHAPNFSRKISADMSRPATQQHSFTQDASYVRAVQISGPPKSKEEHRSTLKKVFGGWMSKKEKKEDWMVQFEKRGIKGGVMTQDEAAAPPVVRY